MKSVIYIKEQKEQEEKPVEFTHFMDENGWVKSINAPIHFYKVVYLGRDGENGDMFAACCKGHSDYIHIYKGHLNSGKY